MYFDWTDERVELLKTLWKDGLSASQIASRLGHITRNAAIGKVHRLGLSGRVKPHQNDAPRKLRKVKPARTSPIPVKSINAARKRLGAPDLPIDSTPLPEPHVCDVARIFSVIDLEPHHCRWIAGDPKQPGWGYCGEHRIPGQSYCHHHATRAFQSAAEVAARLSRSRRQAA